MNFSSSSLDAIPERDEVKAILSAALQAVDPFDSVCKAVILDEQELTILDRSYPLSPGQKINVLALGKAAPVMFAAASEVLGARIGRSLMIPKTPPAETLPGVEVIPGGHPIPTAASLAAGQAALDLARSLTKEDVLLCLISGGGSALMSLPKPPLKLSDLQVLTDLLLKCGANIQEINCLRRQLDQLKGGGLARAAAPARVISLILSDVIGSPLEAIASGPTAPDPTSASDALGILECYGLLGQVPPAVIAVLQRGLESPPSPPSGFDHVHNLILADNARAARAAVQRAIKAKFSTAYLGSAWQGEARKVGADLCQILLSAELPRPFCLVAGGETTVKLRGEGKGGRNQELALASVKPLAGKNGMMLVSLATDGEDGPTDAAGAVVSADTYRRGLEAGLQPDDFLAANNAYAYFDRLGDLLKTGPSGTNVNDLIFLFGFHRSD